MTTHPLIDSVPLPGEQAALDQLFRLVRDRSGLDLTAYRSSTVTRRLSSRMQKLGCRDYLQYYQRLAGDPEEFRELVAHLTVKVSRFFRDARVFARLRTQVLPDLLRDRADDLPLRFWSAGCGNGEEAYSLFLLGQTAAQELDVSSSMVVYGTDVDEGALAEARRAVYRVEAFSETPPEVVVAHFSVRQGRFGPEYELLPVVRQGVTFLRHDLLSEAGPHGLSFDLILCRNVLIYLERPAQERVVTMLRDSLAPGGYLCLGEAEQLSRTQLPYFEVVDRRDGLYRKTSAVPGGR